MPSTRRKTNKAGQDFYEIRVSRGRGKSYLTRRWYVPEGWSQKAIDRELAALCMLEMEIDHITGKEAIELVGRSAPVPGPLPPRKKE